MIRPSANRTEVQSRDFVPSNTFAFTIVVAAPKASSQGVLNNLNSRGRQWSAPVAIQRALAAALAGRTSLVIARRLSTVRAADQILVVDGGQITERGTHDELLGAGGVYARLYRTQFAPQAALPVASRRPVSARGPMP